MATTGSAGRTEILQDIRRATQAADRDFRAEREAVAVRDALRDPARIATAERRRRIAVVVAALLLCLGLTAANLTGHGALRLLLPPPAAEDAPLGLHETLYMGVQDLEAWRWDHGRLPGSPAEAGLGPDGAWTWEAVAGGYLLGATDGLRTEVYDSRTPMETHFAGLGARRARP